MAIKNQTQNTTYSYIKFHLTLYIDTKNLNCYNTKLWGNYTFNPNKQEVMYMVKIKVNKSQLNSAIRKINREMDKQVKREVQKLERELKRKLK